MWFLFYETWYKINLNKDATPPTPQKNPKKTLLSISHSQGNDTLQVSDDIF